MIVSISVPISSCGPSRSPSSSRAAISALVRSSPGLSARPAATALSTSTISRLAAIASAGPMSVETMRLDSRCSRSWWPASTPSSSQMTPIGSGSAKRARRSTTPSTAAPSRPSRSDAVNASMRGCSSSTRRAVNALLMRDRSRRWSAPSAVVIPCTVANVFSGQPSAISPSWSDAKCRAFFATSGCARNSLSASCPRTAMPSTSPGRTTGVTAPCASSRALAACGQPPAGSRRCGGSAAAFTGDVFNRALQLLGRMIAEPRGEAPFVRGVHRTPLRNRAHEEPRPTRRAEKGERARRTWRRARGFFATAAGVRGRSPCRRRGRSRWPGGPRSRRSWTGPAEPSSRRRGTSPWRCRIRRAGCGRPST